jgi:acyl carrier protein
MGINNYCKLIGSKYKKMYFCRKYTQAMVNIDEFIVKVEEEFEDLQNGALKPDSVIREHFNWDSINALIFIAHINVEYEVVINAEDLVKSITIQDLFDIVKSRTEVT